MIKTFDLSEKIDIGDYTLEYNNYMILIKKNKNLIKVVEVKLDFDNRDYNNFADKFRKIYMNRKL